VLNKNRKTYINKTKVNQIKSDMNNEKPKNKGGQVKSDVLNRYGKLGYLAYVRETICD